MNELKWKTSPQIFTAETQTGLRKTSGKELSHVMSTIIRPDLSGAQRSSKTFSSCQIVCKQSS